MKKYTAEGYLIGAIFALLLSCIYSLSAWPFLITHLISFPTLEQAKVYEGVLHIEGSSHRTLNHSWTAPIYYVIDATGNKTKIFWGYPANEREAYDSIAEGMKTKVWFDKYYGVIQQYSIATAEMIKNSLRYQKDANIVADYDYFHSDYEYVRFKEEHFWHVLPAAIGLLFALYYFNQFIRTTMKNKHNPNFE